MAESRVRYGVCRICKLQYTFGADYDYASQRWTPRGDYFSFCCKHCIDAPKNCCKALDCRKRRGVTFLVCDCCDTRGMTCLQCAGLHDVPVGTWYCSETCKVLAGKRKRTDCILPTCTLFHSPSTEGYSDAMQFWQRCEQCEVDACMTCISVCHAGHALGTGAVKHGFMSCGCGLNELSNDLAQRKIARMDEMISLRVEQRRMIKANVEVLKELAKQEAVVALSAQRELEARKALEEKVQGECFELEALGALIHLIDKHERTKSAAQLRVDALVIERDAQIAAAQTLVNDRVAPAMNFDSLC